MAEAKHLQESETFYSGSLWQRACTRENPVSKPIWVRILIMQPYACNHLVTLLWRWRLFLTLIILKQKCTALHCMPPYNVREIQLYGKNVVSEMYAHFSQTPCQNTLLGIAQTFGFCCCSSHEDLKKVCVHVHTWNISFSRYTMWGCNMYLLQL